MAAALGAEVADIDLSKPLPRGRHPGWQEEGWKIPATVEGCTHIAPLRCRWRGRARGTAEARQLAMSALGHVWTAPWQGLSDIAAALVGCGHVSGLLMRRMCRWP